MGENMTTRKFRSLSDTLCVLVNKGPTLGIEDPVPALGVILDALSDEYKAMTADWTTDMIADDQRIAMGATVKRNVDGHKVYVRWSVEDKAYIATVLDLPGCKADGGNLAEVLDEVRKAIRLHVQTQAEIDRENASQNDQQGVAYVWS